MKQQVARLSPHQNGKVFGVLMALSSAFVLVPLIWLASAFGPADKHVPAGLLLAAPLVYLVVGYLSTAFGCLVYNLMARFTGGIEYDARPADPV